jgi:hypothetical protein
MRAATDVSGHGSEACEDAVVNQNAGLYFPCVLLSVVEKKGIRFQVLNKRIWEHPKCTPLFGEMRSFDGFKYALMVVGP